MISAAEADRTKFYSDVYMASFHISDLKQDWKYGQAHLPGVGPEKLFVKGPVRFSFEIIGYDKSAKACAWSLSRCRKTLPKTLIAFF